MESKDTLIEVNDNSSVHSGIIFGMPRAQTSVSTTVAISESPDTSEVGSNLVSNIRSLTNNSGASITKTSKNHARVASIDKSLPELPSSRDLDYDASLYMKEKYLDTQYHYASAKRDAGFHEIFPTLSDERLLDDYSCALSREMLSQGRLYITEHYLCFMAFGIFGFVSGGGSLILSYDEIVRFEKRSTAGLFPNGITIETKEGVHNFASFISRDQTLNFMETIWSKSLALSKLNHEEPREVELDGSRTSMSGLSEQDIYTIDGDSPCSDSLDSSLPFYEEEAELDSSASMKTPVVPQLGRLSSDDSDTNKYPGPLTHEPTTNPIDYSNEAVVLDTEYDIPLGELFIILFGSDNKYHKKNLELNDGSNFTPYGGLLDTKERSFEFDKGLNYPIGPKSTRVFMSETVEALDWEDYVEVLNISKTPNVPSGGAFDCRTRYVLTWGENGKVRLVISYWLEWTGSSWIKGIIESSAESGQKKAAEDCDDIIGEAIKELAKEATKKQKRTQKTPKQNKNPLSPKLKSPLQLTSSLEAQKSKELMDTMVLQKLNSMERKLTILVVTNIILLIFLGWALLYKNQVL